MMKKLLIWQFVNLLISALANRQIDSLTNWYIFSGKNFLISEECCTFALSK